MKFAVELVAWSAPKTSRKKEEEEEKDEKEDPLYRIVSWDTRLFIQLELCTHCSKGPLNLQNTVGEKRFGLGFVSKIECQECKEINAIRTDEVHKDDSKRGPQKSKLNEQYVLGTIHSGNSHQQLEHLPSFQIIQGHRKKCEANYRESCRRQLQQLAGEIKRKH